MSIASPAFLIPRPGKPPPAPSSDKRWRIVEAAMRRHGYAGDALIEVLHAAQDSFGFLDETALRYVSAGLRLPPSRVYGVATFYHHFRLRPQGEHTCVVCLGTACYVKGAAEILAAVERACGVRDGQTTRDGKLSLLTARCLGSCGLAPLCVFDGEVVGRVGPADVLARLGKWVGHDA
jgi:bidirectional [NiFe] hydrogenase diaphorase subunit